MRVKAIRLDDEELPTDLTVEMTVREAALISRFIGPTTHSKREELQHDGGEVGSDIWDALNGSVFNRFWDAGINEVPR